MEFPTVVAQPPLPVDEEMASMMASFVGKPPEEHPVTELVLYTAPRVHRFEDKAGFAPTPGLGGLDTRRSRRARRS